MMLLESYLQLNAKILVEWIIFAEVTVEICMDLLGHVLCNMPATLVSVRSWCSSYMVAIYAIFCFYQHVLCSDRRCCKVVDCLGNDGAMRNVVVQLGVPICDLAVKFCIPQFQALAWLHVDYIQSIF
jgi:hypothetical protein